MKAEIKAKQVWKRNFGAETIEIIEIQDGSARVRQLTPSPGGGPSWGWVGSTDIYEKYSLVYPVEDVDNTEKESCETHKIMFDEDSALFTFFAVVGAAVIFLLLCAMIFIIAMSLLG